MIGPWCGGTDRVRGVDLDGDVRHVDPLVGSMDEATQLLICLTVEVLQGAVTHTFTHAGTHAHKEGINECVCVHVCVCVSVCVCVWAPTLAFL